VAGVSLYTSRRRKRLRGLDDLRRKARGAHRERGTNTAAATIRHNPAMTGGLRCSKATTRVEVMRGRQWCARTCMGGCEER
jgi:hypothetical protein